jgi:N12 class adenine-specific DNA methylase
VTLKDGVPYVVEDGQLQRPSWSNSKTKVNRAKSYVQLRATVQDLMVLMPRNRGGGGDGDAAIEAKRAELNKQYDWHVRKYGPIGKSHEYLEEDPGYYLMLSVEDVQQEPVEKTVKGKKKIVLEKRFLKGDIFNKRTLWPVQEPTQAASVEDAAALSVAWRGGLDVPWMAGLLKLSPEVVERAAVNEGIGFVNPDTGLVEHRNDYLSGEVRKKLEEGPGAGGRWGGAFAGNVEALKQIQPEWLPLENIQFRLGASWLPPEMVQDFLAEVLQVKTRVSYTKMTGQWNVERVAGWYNETNKTRFGVEGFAGDELVEKSLNLKMAWVMKPGPPNDKGKSTSVKDPAKSAEAQAKQKAIQDAFVQWARASKRWRGPAGTYLQP